MSLRELNQIALVTALISVLAQLSLPLPFSPVPLTGQLIGVFLAGALLGGKNAFLALLAYLTLGVAGAPVFSYGRGGPGILFGPSGGYLWGFLPGAFCCGKLLEKVDSPGLIRTAAAMLSCLGCTYLAGTVQLALLMGYRAKAALLAGVVPFFPADLIKIAVAAAASIKIKKSLQLSGLLSSTPPGK